MSRRFGLFALAAMAMAIPAGVPAQESSAVAAARNAGLVGERYDGYLGFAAAPSVSLRAQVNAINIKRRSLYTGLAARRGVSPADVGVTAGCTLVERTGVGEVYALADNVWRKRAPGEGAPHPDYCG